MKPAPNIYRILKSGRDKIDPMETSRIYKIECNKDNETGYYIGLTKRKIKDHKGDILNNEENSNSKNSFNRKYQQITNFNIRNYVFCREAIGIISKQIILGGSNFE